MAYEAYQAYLSVAKTNIRDAISNEYRHQITDGFFDNPSYYKVNIYHPSNPTTSNQVDVWINDNSDTKDLKDILLYPDTVLNYGDIIYWNDDDSYWLNFQSNNKGNIYYSGLMQKCLSTLKWLDENGTVQEQWFTYKTDVSRQLGIKDGNVIIQPNETRYLLLQQNDATLKLKKSQRFIFGGSAWRLTAIDTILTGLVYVELQQADIDTVNDNVDLRICDYYNNQHNYAIAILNGDSSMTVGSTLQINTQVKDNGVVVSGQTLSYSSSNTSIATIDSNGLITSVAEGSVTITVSLANNSSVTASINLTVVVSLTDNYTISITGSDSLRVNQSLTYSASVLNNGVTDNSKTVSWNVYASDGVNITDLAMITSENGTSATLKGNSNAQTGNIILKAVLVGNSSITKEYPIQIKSLWG